MNLYTLENLKTQHKTHRFAFFFFFLITPIHTMSFYQLNKNKKKNNKSCISSVRPQSRFGVAVPMAALHRCRSGILHPIIGFGSVGRCQRRYDWVCAGRLGRLRYQFAHPYPVVPSGISLPSSFLEVGISSNAITTFPDGTSTQQRWNWTPIHMSKEVIITAPLFSCYKQENELRSGGWQFWREQGEKRGTILGEK